MGFLLDQGQLVAEQLLALPEGPFAEAAEGEELLAREAGKLGEREDALASERIGDGAMEPKVQPERSPAGNRAAEERFQVREAGFSETSDGEKIFAGLLLKVFERGDTGPAHYFGEPRG